MDSILIEVIVIELWIISSKHFKIISKPTNSNKIINNLTLGSVIFIV